MSLQTQEVFKKLVNDTIIQSDPTVTISNIRKAIKDTNVVLNTAISPRIILIPSNLIILDKMIAGYNNVFKLATSSMKFGENDDVNYSKPSEEPSDEPASTSRGSTSTSSGSTSTSSGSTSTSRGNTGPIPVSKEAKMNESELVLLVTTLVGGSIISKFLI